MYRWLVFLHVLGALGLFLVNGAIISVMIRLKREREAERIDALLSLRDLANRWMGPALLIVILSGTILGFVGRWWSQTWIWASLGTIVFVAALSAWISHDYQGRIRGKLRVETGNPTYMTTFDPGLVPDQIEPLLLTKHTPAMALLNAVGLMFVLYLMIFKPV